MSDDTPPVRIGIDLGGTKIEGIALDHTGAELARRRVPTPREYGASIAAIAALVAGLEAVCGRRGTVGVGIPGIVSPVTGLVKNANSTWLIGKPLDQDLETALERPVRLENDANCFAVSEAADGAAAGAGVVFGVIVGTGCGGGLVVHGRVLTGRNAIGGEWGHNPLPWPDTDEWPGPPCYCGKQGCIETFVSGTGLAADFQRVTGTALPAPEIVRRAAAGDGPATAALERHERRLAKALATVINIVDPDVIVLGGGVSNIDRLYQTLPRLLPEYVFSDSVTTPIVPPRHGDSSGVRGAAWLWNRD
ncbi:MAG: fructokinase [Candidatus Riflebacteria bacterium]|nr:fructokinase [Candidatus Riflebacteria bacterium]